MSQVSESYQCQALASSLDRFSHLLTRHSKGRVSVGVGIVGDVGGDFGENADDVNDELDGIGGGGGWWADWRDPTTLTRLVGLLMPVRSDVRPTPAVGSEWERAYRQAVAVLGIPHLPSMPNHDHDLDLDLDLDHGGDRTDYASDSATKVGLKCICKSTADSICDCVCVRARARVCVCVPM